METLYSTLLLILITPIITLFLTLALVTLRIYAFKSIQNPNFPPAKGTVLNLALRFHDIHDYLAAIAAEHQTFRILLPAAASYVFTTEPRNIEHVLKANFGKYSKGERTQESLADLLGDGILLADGERWSHQRKLAALEFSTRVLKDFSCSVFRKNAVKLVRVVSEFSGQVFDMQGLLMRWTLDSIFEVGFGVELNCLEIESSKEEATKFMKALDDLNASVYWRLVDPFWKLKRFLHIGSEVSLRKQAKIVEDFVDQLITKKRAILLALKAKRDHHCIKNEKEDILSRFLWESEKDPERMNDKYLRDIILNFMIAGKDTTGGTLSWFFYMLCKHPSVQEKITQEVKSIVVQDDDSDDIHNFVTNITEEALEKMHYLHAALTETLRLYPAIPMDGRCADVEDTLANGFRIKKGDEVFYASYSMGRMPYLWGDDATDFRPERWLHDGVFQPESPFKFIAFHAGPRICLGKDFAYRQMKIVSIALLRYFWFKLSDETNNLKYKSLITLHIDGELSICALPRTTSPPTRTKP